jgi:hypothetical protein
MYEHNCGVNIKVQTFVCLQGLQPCWECFLLHVKQLKQNNNEIS